MPATRSTLRSTPVTREDRSENPIIEGVKENITARHVDADWVQDQALYRQRHTGRSSRYFIALGHDDGKRSNLPCKFQKAKRRKNRL